MIKRLLSFLVIAFLLSGCLYSEPSATSITVTLAAESSAPSATPLLSTTTVLPTMTFTLLPEPSVTPNVPRSTYTKTSTPTIPPEIMRYRCLDVTQGFPPDDSVNGTIYVNVGPSPSSQWSDIYKIDLEAKLLISSSEYDEYVASPNGLWLAIYHPTTDQTHLIVNEEIRIESSDGERIATYPWESNWQGFRWLDNEHLIIYYQSDPIYYLYSIQVINPFTGTQSNILPDFPEIDLYATPYHPVFPILDPSLTKVVYPRMGKDGNAWVLWDLSSNRELAALASGVVVSFAEVPAWSPDGSQFVVDLRLPDWLIEEFFSVNRDGSNLIKLTHFNNFATARTKIRIQEFSWSPDGRYIAFWIAVDPSPYSGERLAILDMNTMDVTNYCVHGSDWLNEGGSAAPIWSPNSQQLVVESYDAQGFVHTVLVDIARDFAYNIADCVRPNAWTINTP